MVQVNALQSESALLMDCDGKVVAVALIGNSGSNNKLRYGVGVFVPCPCFYTYFRHSLYIFVSYSCLYSFFIGVFTACFFFLSASLSFHLHFL